jgi:hypothetical protein
MFFASKTSAENRSHILELQRAQLREPASEIELGMEKEKRLASLELLTAQVTVF